MRFLKCGHRSTSDDIPECPICPALEWLTPDVDSLPCRQFDDENQKLWQCAICGSISDEPYAMPEQRQTHKYNLHYCGCRDKLFSEVMGDLFC